MLSSARRSCARSFRIGLLAATAMLLPGVTHAAPTSVRGTITLPQALLNPRVRGPRLWPRIENGVLPIAPPLVSPMSDVVVVLEGSTRSAAWSGTMVMDIAGFDFSPRVVPLLIGTTVEFKNTDRISYNIHSPDNAAFFGKEETAPGRSRKIKFLAPGVFPVRTDEFPHMEGAVLVLQSNLFAKPDERGTFRIEGVPEGRYTLRIFYRSGFVHEQSLEVTKAPLDLTIRIAAPAAPKRSE